MTIENRPASSPSRFQRGGYVFLGITAIAIAALVMRVGLERGVHGLFHFAATGASDLGRAGSSHPLTIAVGTVANHSGVGGDELAQAAQESMRSTLSTHGDITLDSGNAATERAAHARSDGHYFDANIQSIQQTAQGVRATISVVVSANPSRSYEFEASSSITLSGGTGDLTSAQQDAVRRAAQSATNRALNQLLQPN